jgi:hypothetical protein
VNKTNERKEKNGIEDDKQGDKDGEQRGSKCIFVELLKGKKNHDMAHALEERKRSKYRTKGSIWSRERRVRSFGKQNDICRPIKAVPFEPTVVTLVPWGKLRGLILLSIHPNNKAARWDK